MSMQPLEEYALIGDCHTAALVSDRGAVEWLCLPDFASSSVFGALLDREKGGIFELGPSVECERRQRYVDDTNVLETRFECPHGVVTLTDCFVAAPHVRGELQPERELLRICQCEAGEVPVELCFKPRPNYGRAAPRLHSLGKLGWQCRYRGMDAILATSFPVKPSEDCTALRGEIVLRAGQRAVASWAYSDREICVLPSLNDAEARCANTEQWWRSWIGQCRYDGVHAASVRRSALALKLMTSALTGAVIAAPTTSLPEYVGGTRNWDYRYCWIRDSALATRAFLSLGFEAEASAFQHWLLRTVRLPWSKLQVVYDLWGDHRLEERELTHLAGYAGSRPVRIGNAASEQFQADLYGELISSTGDFVSRGGALSADERRLLRGIAKDFRKLWPQPDEGIWEKRNTPRHHTFSKAMFWVAIEQLLQIDARLALHTDNASLRSQQNAIRREIEGRGFDETTRSYVGEYDTHETDASLLLLPRYGYIDARHPRMLGTFEEIEQTLTRGPHVWRYRVEDGIGGGENAFLPCSFWAVEYLALAGRTDEAAKRLEELLACASPAGLYAEEYSVDLSRMLGNYPQALTHESLIGAVLSLNRVLEGRNHD